MLYRYEFFEGTERETVSNIELENDVAAIQEGYKTAYEMVEDGVKLGVDRAGWSIQIFNDRDILVQTISLDDVLTQRRSEFKV
ncbi:hypothetical protein [Phyllobacterium ifriqiyense]|uniref:hypothetical protein n=1 Tax=Phyllobacterium ifriqiyense TaxID=314238 RepID=UPI003392859F